MDIIFTAPPYLAVTLAMGLVLAVAWLLLGLGGEAGRVQRLRLRLDTAMGPGAAHSARTSRGFSDRVLDLFQSLGGRVGPKEEARQERDRQRLILAGYRGPRAAQIFQGLKLGLALGPAGVFFALQQLFVPDMAAQNAYFLVVALAALGSFAPDWHLRRRTTRRRLSLANELPDVLDLMVVCVESGMGLDQAIHRVCEEVAQSCPVISQELAQLNLELRAGRRRQDALKDLSRRVDLEDLNSLITLLIQADMFGISVARTLRVYSDTLRTKRHQRAEEMAAKLPAKLLLPLVLCILPALLVTIMAPAGLHLMHVFNRINP